MYVFLWPFPRIPHFHVLFFIRFYGSAFFVLPFTIFNKFSVISAFFFSFLFFLVSVNLDFKTPEFLFRIFFDSTSSTLLPVNYVSAFSAPSSFLLIIFIASLSFRKWNANLESTDYQSSVIAIAILTLHVISLRLFFRSSVNTVDSHFKFPI